MKKISLKKVILLLTSLSIILCLQKIYSASASMATDTTFYIRQDGRIDPQPAPISTSDNVTYTFSTSWVYTGNTKAIVVERSNIIVNGNGLTLEGSGTEAKIGINLYNINNVTITKASIKNFQYGLYFNTTSHDTISANFITTNSLNNICLYKSSNNTISENNITANNYCGIQFTESSDNIITGNNIKDYQNNAIGIFMSSNNKFYHNNFVNNTKNVNFIASVYVNIWNDTIEGNYWSDYNGTDSDNDGIGDSSFAITPPTTPSEKKQSDHHPLMGMFYSHHVSMGYNINVVSNSTIKSIEYYESNSTIKTCVSNMTTNQLFGFCRICIPHALISEPYHVLVNGSEPYFWNYELYDDGENRWIYFTYQHSELEIIIVPEFSWLRILPLLNLTGLLAVAVSRKRHIAPR